MENKTHKFDIREKKHLDNWQRQKLLPSYEILHRFGLNPGDRFADLGAGTGYFTFPASEITGIEGMIYAMDISSEMLKELEDKIPEKNSSNIKTIKVTEESLVIGDNAVNFALACNVLHEVDNLILIINELKRILLTGGKLLIVEWKKIRTLFGPPLHHRLAPEELIPKLENAGFKSIEKFNLNKKFYALTCIK